jgi:hypothetical protein
METDPVAGRGLKKVKRLAVAKDHVGIDHTASTVLGNGTKPRSSLDGTGRGVGTSLRDGDQDETNHAKATRHQSGEDRGPKTNQKDG